MNAFLWGLGAGLALGIALCVLLVGPTAFLQMVVMRLSKFAAQ